MDFQSMLLQIMTYFNSDERWPFTVQNTSTPQALQLTCMWNWKNANLIRTQGISDAQRQFRTVYTIFPNGTYRVQDISMTNNKGFLDGVFGVTKSMIKGKQIGMHKEIAIGRNNLNGYLDGLSFDFNTEKIHKPMDQVLQSYGLTKVF